MFRNGYLFGSRILTHTLFWAAYYILFSLIWAKGSYYESFGLEFILLPIRITASYISMYFLIPNFLLKKKEVKFGMYYLLVIIIGGILQRLFTYFYYELLILETTHGLLSIGGIIQSVVLINTTVLLLSALKIFQYWKIEHEKKEDALEELIEIRAEKRNYRVNPKDIRYIEGLGNYVIFYLKDDKKLISYISLKEAEELLPDSFMRSHKSFVINKDHVQSYTNDSVEISGRILPVGKSVQIEF
ncbi:LytR/AlgR family response regulator transcription factor [Fulvivirga lutea]|uniref:LytTR family transcriptional regulator n=1 Tax=Fulvivirga lutea TaxID=2810512 RepID=A0A974WPF8_9BACT|nr:LytTR family DNA-binding domain-containing protein [Fulvivirga lutea]QSE99228.1 LytTR family transcriptional regulator [Fulvivirga lutea]